MVDTHFAAWLAGFFDGEGSITIERRTGGLVISIAQSERSILEQIQHVYGGRINIACHRGAPIGGGSRYRASKDSYNIQFRFWEARALLRDILPYVQLKKAKVELALDYIATTMSLISLRGGLKPGARLTAIEREARLNFYKRLRALDNPSSEPTPPVPVSPQLPFSL